MTSSCDHTFRDFSLNVLRKAGCRITKQRVAVIECISKAKKPLSAPELFEQLCKRSKGAPLDRVSVYRVLDTLFQLNLVHRISPNGAYMACNHQDCANAHHIMSRCTECEEVRELDVPREVVAPLLSHMKHKLHFTPDSHLLHMDGRCNSCSKLGGIS